MRRQERKDPLGYRTNRANGAPVRAPRPPQRPVHAPRRRNRRRVSPVAVWNERFRTLRNWLLVVLVVECAWLALSSPRLVVRHVDVTGATVRRPAEIIRTAGLTQPGNILRAHTRRAADRLRLLPEVASARVERRFPDRLLVRVTERRALASVRTPNAVWLIDPSGIAFRRVAKPLPHAPVFTSAVSAPVALGKAIPVPALNAALACLAAIPRLPLQAPVSFHVTQAGEAWLDGPDHLKIRLGPLDDAPARLAVTARLLKGPDGPQILQKAAVLDMTMPKNENYKPREPGPEHRLSTR